MMYKKDENMVFKLGYPILLIKKSSNRVQTIFKELGYEIKL